MRKAGGWVGGRGFLLAFPRYCFLSFVSFLPFPFRFLITFPFLWLRWFVSFQNSFPLSLSSPLLFFLLAYSIAPRTPLGPGSCHVDTPTIPKDGQVFSMYGAMKGFNHCASYAPQLPSLNTVVEERPNYVDARGSRDCQENKLPYFPPVCIDFQKNQAAFAWTLRILNLQDRGPSPYASNCPLHSKVF